jgi:hypothetical protein
MIITIIYDDGQFTYCMMSVIRNCRYYIRGKRIPTSYQRFADPLRLPEGRESVCVLFINYDDGDDHGDL